MCIDNKDYDLKSRVCEICTEKSVHVLDGIYLCKDCYKKHYLSSIGDIDKSEFNSEEKKHIPKGEVCEICDDLAVNEYGGIYYCEDCYDTEILNL